MMHRFEKLLQLREGWSDGGDMCMLGEGVDPRLRRGDQQGRNDLAGTTLVP